MQNNTDLVVLAACGTAAPDGRFGTSALSHMRSRRCPTTGRAVGTTHEEPKTGQVRVHRYRSAWEATPQIPAQLSIETDRGRAFSPERFGTWIANVCRAAGVPEGFSAHEPRKSAARRLAEAGASTHEIAAITGHKTLKEIERYTEAADCTRNAEAAMRKLTGTNDEQKLPNQPKKPSNPNANPLKI